MRLCLIYNPAAGGAERIRAFFDRLTSQHHCELRAMRSLGEAAGLVRAAARGRFDRIVAAGGDGTISHVIAGMAPAFADVEMAVLPLGTGNDLARALGVSAQQFDAACDVALGPRVARIDAVRITTGGHARYAINVANGGLGGNVTTRVRAEDKQRWGALAYWMQSVSRLMELAPFDVEMALDGRRIELDAYGVAVANGRYVGGGFPIAPHARLDDGILDVTVVPVLPRVELITAGLNFVLARDERDDRVRCFRARQVELRSRPTMPMSIDGEPTLALDAAFEILPGAIRMAVGDHPPGLSPAPERGPLL